MFTTCKRVDGRWPESFAEEHREDGDYLHFNNEGVNTIEATVWDRDNGLATDVAVIVDTEHWTVFFSNEEMVKIIEAYNNLCKDIDTIDSIKVTFNKER